MHRSRCLLLLFPICGLIAGCEKLWPTVTASDEQAARHAMPISEISLMVRSHYDQNKIIAEIERRHVPVAIDGKTEESLVRFGAKPALMAALKNNANVLTKTQRQAFDELAVKRESTTASGPAVHEKLNRRQPDDWEQQTVALPMNSLKLAKTDTPEEAYWKAEAAYRAKKKQLESRIASEQGSINWKRAHGYHQSALTSAEDSLHQHEDELKNLQVPMR